MKKAISSKNYYEEYLEICSSISPTSKILDFHQLVKKNHPASNIDFPFGVCLIDYTRNGYPYISDNCLDITGYTADEYKKGGLDFNELIFHPEDKEIFSQQVFCDIGNTGRKFHQKKFPNTGSHLIIVTFVKMELFLKFCNTVPIINYKTRASPY